MSARLANILFLAGLLAQTLHAQPTVNDDTIDVTFGAEGITLETAIEWASNSTDRPFQFKDTDFRSKPRIMMTGKVSIAKDRIFEFWQAIFVTQGFAMVPLGPG